MTGSRTGCILVILLKGGESMSHFNFPQSDRKSCNPRNPPWHRCVHQNVDSFLSALSHHLNYLLWAFSHCGFINTLWIKIPRQRFPRPVLHGAITSPPAGPQQAAASETQDREVAKNMSGWWQLQSEAGPPRGHPARLPGARGAQWASQVRGWVLREKNVLAGPILSPLSASF